MSNCSTGCSTQDHETYGQCMRAKRAKVAYCNTAGGMDATTQRNWDKDLDHYREARKQGIQPSGTDRQSVDRAIAISDITSTAYQAG